MDTRVSALLICLTLLAACSPENLSGDASKRPDPPATVQEVLDVLSHAKIVTPCERRGSGCGPFLAKDMTADEYCRQAGYRACVGVQNSINEVYFVSVDGTCQGEFRYVDTHLHSNSPADCQTRFDDTFIEFYELTPTDGGVTCQQGGYGQSDHWRAYGVSFLCA